VNSPVLSSLSWVREFPLSLKNVDGATKTMKLWPRWRPRQAREPSVLLISIKIPPLSPVKAFFGRLFQPVLKIVSIHFSLWNGIIGMINGTVAFTPTGPSASCRWPARSRTRASARCWSLRFHQHSHRHHADNSLPPLDGARIAFIAIEWARRGKRISARVENIVHSAGFIILLAVMC